MDTIIKAVREELISNADERTRISGDRIFKENIKSHNAKNFIKICY